VKARSKAKQVAKDTVLLLGAGRMGGALLKGWIASRRFSSIQVIETSPSKAIAALATRKKIKLTKHFDLRLRPRAIVIALKPQVIKSEAALLNDLGKTGALVVSIAAGITINFLRNALGTGIAIVRTVPNTPGAIGQGITALYAPPGTAKADRALGEALMAPLGETLWFDNEAAMDAVTALSGSGPAYVFLLAEALAKAGTAQGLAPAVATRLVRATITGAGALLAADPRPAEELRRDVTSPAGTTEAALKVLMDKDGFEALMTRAVAAAAKRSKELGSN
jgi:pyrroline-5-carboxylate reductase